MLLTTFTCYKIFCEFFYSIHLWSTSPVGGPSPEGWGDHCPAQQLTSDSTLMSSQGAPSQALGISEHWLWNPLYSPFICVFRYPLTCVRAVMSYEQCPLFHCQSHPHILPVAGATSSKWLPSFPVLGPLHFSCPGFCKGSRPDEGELKDDLSTLLKTFERLSLPFN